MAPYVWCAMHNRGDCDVTCGVDPCLGKSTVARNACKMLYVVMMITGKTHQEISSN